MSLVHGMAPRDTNAAVAALQERAVRMAERVCRIKASALQQVGEHEIANLVLNQRGAYADMLEVSGLQGLTGKARVGL